MDLTQLRQLAEAGDAAAAVDFGYACAEGDGMAPDMEQALHWWRVAAEKNFARGQLALGRHFEKEKDGDQAMYWYEQAIQAAPAEAIKGIEQLIESDLIPNDDRHLKLLTRAAETGNAECQYLLAMSFDMDTSTERDTASAFYWMRKAAENDYPEACGLLGVFYSEGSGTPVDKNQAFRWILKAAEAGIPQSLTSIGGMFLEGIGTEPDLERAIYWLKKAASSSPIAQALLAQCFFRKENDPQAVQAGLAWLLKAAESGLPDAQFQMGMVYASGSVVEKDWRKATAWLTLAGQNGVDEAWEVLKQGPGEFAEGGSPSPLPFDESTLPAARQKEYQRLLSGAIEGHPQDAFALSCLLHLWQQETGQTTPAEFWTQRAADLGHPVAQYNVAVLYASGSGREVDLEKAAQWFEKSAAQALAPAMTELGYGLITGKIGMTDEARGAAYLKEAAEKDMPEAQFLYALCLLEGIGVAIDRAAATEWLQRAQRLNHPKAVKLLSHIWNKPPEERLPYSLRDDA